MRNIGKNSIKFHRKINKFYIYKYDKKDFIYNL